MPTGKRGVERPRTKWRDVLHEVVGKTWIRADEYEDSDVPMEITSSSELR